MAESLSVNFSGPKSFSTKLKSKCKETLFPDDPFKQFRNEKHRAIKALQYFIPFFEWIPNYNLKLLRYDVLAGITITSLAIPQGISYAKLASIPPIIGLCKKPFWTRTRVASFFLKKYHWPSPWSIGFFLIDHILFWPLNWMIIFVLLICRFELCSTTCICRIRELKASSSGNGSSMLAANSRHDWTKSATQKGSNIVPSLGFHGYLFHRHFPDSFRFSKVITNY